MHSTGPPMPPAGCKRGGDDEGYSGNQSQGMSVGHVVMKHCNACDIDALACNEYGRETIGVSVSI